ncbi:MAG: NAD(P)/FAD-dependent oxidoreductase [Oscillospiraceae bacterium]|nr:NAD(P)/FAD-dependent oxidoreductase [Oscillospiraceae bacterium]
MKYVDLLIVGGGPAGLAAAAGARESGISSILLVERNKSLGGILNQCIHNGFGLHFFKEELTGPEYAHRFEVKVKELNIDTMLNSMIIDITPDKIASVLTKEGVIQVAAKSIILAMGCRERPRGSINIYGSRPAGVLTAGACQEYINLKGLLPGKRVVILGSGDIGLIMARRLTIEGAKVIGVFELLPYSSGLNRNIAQCLNDFDIPLKFNHTVTRIIGKQRVEAVEVCEVDEKRVPKKETAEIIECDTLLLSVGLIPENELSKKIGVKLSRITGGAIVDSDLQTSVPGVFSCGNVLQVHDLVDNVSNEAYKAAKSAAKYLKGEIKKDKYININPGFGVRYTVPSFTFLNSIRDGLEINFRSDNVYRNSYISVYFDQEKVYSKKKKILTPGEMEIVNIKNQTLSPENISVKVEFKEEV